MVNDGKIHNLKAIFIDVNPFDKYLNASSMKSQFEMCREQLKTIEI